MMTFSATSPKTFLPADLSAKVLTTAGALAGAGAKRGKKKDLRKLLFQKQEKNIRPRAMLQKDKTYRGIKKDSEVQKTFFIFSSKRE